MRTRAVTHHSQDGMLLIRLLLLVTILLFTRIVQTHHENNRLLKIFIISFQVFIIMKNLQSGLEWMWSRTKFINRKYLMQEMYQDFEEGEDWELPDERDPFTESDSTEIMIGCVEVYLESIGYMVCECTCCSKKLWL
jgi:hypothetical protein